MQDVSEDKHTFSLVIDTKQRRPACVLLQAAMGGDSSIVSELLTVDSWLLAPNKDMYLVTGTKEQWRQFGESLKKRFHKPAGKPPAPPRRR